MLLKSWLLRFGLAASICATPVVVCAAADLSITTWNLQHMMSERRFDEWAAFCSKYQWSEDVVKASGGQKPKYLSYCNANNGMLWPSDVRESKTLQTKSAFAEKVAALTK